MRRLSQGRFSEIMGEQTVKLDENFRTFQFKKTCENILAKARKLDFFVF